MLLMSMPHAFSATLKVYNLSVHGGDDPSRGFLNLDRASGEAQAHVALAAGTESRARREPHEGLVDEAEREAVRVGFADDREEQVECTRGLRELDAAGGRKH